MSATLFLAICILGCDFLLYFLYQWTYGERRRGLSRRSPSRKAIFDQPNAQPFPVSSGKREAEQRQSLRVVGGRAAKREVGGYVPSGESQAHRRIAASFAQAKR
jgi:hypothetical protein